MKNNNGKLKILVATRNLGKFNGLMEGLNDLPFEFLSLKDLEIEGDPEENGTTYEENAILKAEYFGRKANMVTISDDSGIVVEALAGELGLKTRRWGAGHEANDEEWLDFFLKRMEMEKNREAEFVCVVALFRPGQMTITFRGETQGSILDKPQVAIQHGIPLSSVFLPKGKNSVYLSLSQEDLKAISHRGKAVRKCHDFLFENWKL